MILIIDFHLATKLRKSDATPQFRHMALWRAHDSFTIISIIFKSDSLCFSHSTYSLVSIPETHDEFRLDFILRNLLNLILACISSLRLSALRLKSFGRIKMLYV
jgi:hypothetical protein